MDKKYVILRTEVFALLGLEDYVKCSFEHGGAPAIKGG
jgi:hypothetical protein